MAFSNAASVLAHCGGSRSECTVSTHPDAGEHILGSVLRHVDLIPIYTAIFAAGLAIQFSPGTLRRKTTS